MMLNARADGRLSCFGKPYPVTAVTGSQAAISYGQKPETSTGQHHPTSK